MTTEINPQIFREYDIRGVVGPDLTPETVQYIGQAIGTYMKRQGGKTLVMGWDIRSSSIEFRDILSKALTSTGCDVVDIGKVPTPVSYFALHHLKADGGVMITGSHNPPEFNGFKISQGQNSLYGEKIQELKKMIDAKDFETGSGKVEQANIMESYMDHICSILNISRKVKVVVDGGNGCFGITGPQLLRKLGQEPIEIFCEPDGTFPNHHPDPTDESTLKILSDKMKEVNADIGIGFDGDGDRIGVIDKKGRPIAGDLLTAFLSNSLEIKDKENQTVILDIKSSYVAYDKIISFGLNAEIGKTGHSNIKKRIKEINSPLAGEMSGHIFFADKYYGYDDALYASIRIISLMANDNSLDDFISTLPKTYVSPEIKLYCSDKIKFKLINRLVDKVLKDYNPENVITLDGVRAKNEMGWWLIRASNTEEAIVVRFEGKSEKDQDKLLIEVKERLKNEGLTWEYS